MEKKIVMRSLLFPMNVTAMYLVLHQAEVELDLQVLKEVELDLQVLKEVELDLRVLKEVELDLRDQLVKQDLRENKGYKVLQDLQDLLILLLVQLDRLVTQEQ
jgi:hypothetical protein